MKYDFQCWAENDDGQLIRVGVIYSISGRYLPATFWHPEEFPDIEFLVYDMVSGQEISSLVSERDLDKIESMCWLDNDLKSMEHF